MNQIKFSHLLFRFPRPPFLRLYPLAVFVLVSQPKLHLTVLAGAVVEGTSAIVAFQDFLFSRRHDLSHFDRPPYAHYRSIPVGFRTLLRVQYGDSSQFVGDVLERVLFVVLPLSVEHSVHPRDVFGLRSLVLFLLFLASFGVVEGYVVDVQE